MAITSSSVLLDVAQSWADKSHGIDAKSNAAFAVFDLLAHVYHAHRAMVERKQMERTMPDYSTHRFMFEVEQQSLFDCACECGVRFKSVVPGSYLCEDCFQKSLENYAEHCDDAIPAWEDGCLNVDYVCDINVPF